MAEMLIKATDATHHDPLVDACGCYKRGMPVVVMEDGHEWGSEEGPPKFYVIKFPGVSAESLRKYIAPWLNTDQSGKIVGVKRREWQFQLNELDPSVLQILESTGSLSVQTSQALRGSFDLAWNQFRSICHNHKTNLRESGTP